MISNKGKEDQKSYELYDLTTDKGETTNVEKENPAVVKRLAAALAKAVKTGKTR